MNPRPVDCEDVIRHLLEYLDRDLDEETLAAIGHHLEHCRSCFSRAEFERRIKQELHRTGEAKASQRLRARIKDLLGKF